VVEELLKRQRKGKRQANQFARENGKKEGDKKKAGRTPGHEGDWRQTPDHVDDEVEARLDGCPFCGDFEAWRALNQEKRLANVANAALEKDGVAKLSPG
jgi:hypothetical protein